MYDGISLCTGIGGFELGMQIAGLDSFINLRECVEISPYCQEVIKQRFPGVSIHSDLKTYHPTGYDGNRTIIWSGFPCQPVSGAGKQRGDKDERYLWAEIIRLIRTIRPAIWLGENVDGLRTVQSGRLFASILRELSESGYCVEWSCVSAAEVGAVHQRERIWIIAYPQSINKNESQWQTNTVRNEWQSWMESGECCSWDRRGNLPNVTNANESTSAMEESGSSGQRRESTNASEPTLLRQEHGAISSEGNRTGDRLSSNTNSIGRSASSNSEREHPNLLHQERNTEESQQQKRSEWGCGSDSICPSDASNTNSNRWNQTTTTSASTGGDDSERRSQCSENTWISGVCTSSTRLPEIQTRTTPDTQSGKSREQNQCDRLSQTKTDITPVSSSTEDSTNTNSKRLEGRGAIGWSATHSRSVLLWEQNAKPVFCFSNARIPANLDRYLLRHRELTEWLSASTIPTFTRLTSNEVKQLSPEDQAEYRKLLKEYQSTKREYERWLEALGNAIVPQQAAVAWRQVGQILGLPTIPV